MNVYSFFRLLNRKIKQYEKTAYVKSEKKAYVTVVWVEDANISETDNFNKQAE